MIQPPDRHFLLAAQGWIELGNLSEASLELERISPEFRNHPDVLELRWQIHAQAKHWEQCVEIATALIQAAPTQPMGWIHRSYALHELRRTTEARDGLQSILKIFPDELTIPYNLACYECTLGNEAKAKEWLGKVFATDQAAQWKAMALQDPDLKPLWPFITALGMSR